MSDTIEATSTPIPGTAIATFADQSTEIAKLQADYLTLTVKDGDDKAGFTAVDKGRRDAKRLRCAVDKRRKELTGELERQKKKINGEADVIFEAIEPVETHFIAQCKIYNDAQAEQARLVAEAAERERVAAIEAEKARVQAEQEAERLRLRAIADEQTAKAAELAAAQKKIDDDKAALEAEKQRFAEATKAPVKESLPLFPEDAALPTPQNATQAAIFAGVRPPLPRHDFAGVSGEIINRQFDESAASVALDGDTVEIAAVEITAVDEATLLKSEMTTGNAAAVVATATPAPNDFFTPPWETEKHNASAGKMVLTENPDKTKLAAIAVALDSIAVPEVTTPAGEEASTAIVLLLEETAGKIREILERM